MFLIVLNDPKLFETSPNGSIELAVKYGIADFILDLVQSGKTLKDNQLYENVIINNDISTVIISSYFAFDLKKRFIKKLRNSNAFCNTG